MSSYVDYKNKNGIKYVYTNVSTWNKKKQKCDTKRKCIGKRDPITGEIIFNNDSGNTGRNKTTELSEQRKSEKPTILSCGATLVLDKTSVETKLRETLKECFPDKWDKILTTAYFLASEGRSVSHCDVWSCSTKTPMGKKLTNQRISELCSELNSEEQMRFFKAWIKHHDESNYHALDITSISSYSTLNEMVRYGYNRDKEELPQINMCMLMGNKSRIPMYFEVLPGSIRDINTLKKVIADLKWLDADKLRLVMDKGFCSEENIDGMYAAGYKFLIGMSFVSNLTKEWVKNVREDIDDYENFHTISGNDIFAKCQRTKWKGHRCYVHTYFDSAKADGEYRALLRRIEQMKLELEINKQVKTHKSDYAKYFIVNETPIRGRKVEVIQSAIDEFKSSVAGYFVLISNNIKDPVEALEIYRSKDAVEKGFDNLKDILDCKRLRTHSATTMQGKIFLQFIALILVSHIQNIMRVENLYKNYTYHSVIDELKLLHQVTYPHKRKPTYTELTKSQKNIFSAFRIDVSSYV